MFKKKQPPVGSIPGFLTESKELPKPRIHIIEYSKENLTELSIDDVNALEQFKGSKGIIWIDVQGLGDNNVLQKIADIFELHQLAIADVVNIPSRAKVEDYDSNIFLITAMAEAINPPDIHIEQFSIFLGSNFVITFQEDYGDILDPVRERIRKSKGAVRKHGSDYLAYAIVDTIVDGYYPLLEKIGEYLEELEDEVINNPGRETMENIYWIKRELLTIRRAIWPQREVLNALSKSDNKLIKKQTKIFLRDTYDHCIQTIDVLENYREICGSLADLYLSSVSNKLNEVMKVLTMISTIFMPLSFIAGIWGMNFKYMPELDSPFGYPLALALMTFVAILMFIYFKRKGWFGKPQQ